MNEPQSLTRCTFALLGCLWATPALAQAPAPAPAPAQSSAPSATSEPAPAPLGTVRLTAAEVIARVLADSPTLAQAKLELQDAQQAVTVQDGRYPFIAFGQAGLTHANTPRRAAGDTTIVSSSDSLDASAGLRRTFATGTSAELSVSGSRFSAGVTRDPSPVPNADPSSGTGYDLRARASVTQPLLRGFGAGVGEVELRVARMSEEQSRRALARVRSEVVRDALKAYWELWYAQQALELNEASLRVAERARDEAQLRADAGGISRTDVLSFQTRVAALQESVVSGEIQVEQRGLELNRILGSEQEALPVATSEALPKTTSVSKAQLERALTEDSLQLAELQLAVKRARERLPVAADASRTRLDLSGYVESRGVGDALGSASGRTASFNALTAYAGVTIEAPLNDARFRAERERATLDLRRAQTSLQLQRQRLRAEVANLLAAARAASRRVRLAEETARVARASYEAESERYRLGSALALEVQQAEDAWRSARLRALRARVDQLGTQLELQHLAGALLAPEPS